MRPRFLIDKNNNFVRSAFCSLMFLSLNDSVNAAQMLQILPPRIVIEEGRSASLTLVNRNNESGEYRLSTRNIRTGEDGRFEIITEANEDELFADKMLRYSPRRVTVDGQSKQDVRVVVRKPKDLKEGEYRSHLVFRSIPKPLDQTSEGANSISMQFNPTLEITIPVIVRHGDLTAEINLTDQKLTVDEEGQQHLEFTINREGTRSIYGEISAWWTPIEGQKEVRIGMAKGISVYYPNSLRYFSLPVSADQPISKGRIRVEYKEDPTYGGDKTTETTFLLP